MAQSHIHIDNNYDNNNGKNNNINNNKVENTVKPTKSDHPKGIKTYM